MRRLGFRAARCLPSCTGLAMVACGGLLGVDFNNASLYPPDGGDGEGPRSIESGAGDDGGGDSASPPPVRCDAGCAMGTFCNPDDGSCVEVCPPPLSACDSACVNLQNDPNHCGRCDIACAGAACGGGACGGEVIASGLLTPDGLVLDATYVYWCNGGVPGEPTTGALLRAPKAGGPWTALAGGEVGPGPLAIDATNLYWAHDAVLTQMPIGGGARTTVAPLDFFQFAIGGGTAFLMGPATISSVALGGSGTKMVLATSQGQPNSIAADAANVYWTDTGSGTVLQMPAGGGSILTLGAGQTHPYGVAVDGAYVYWTTSPTTLNRVPIGGGTISNYGSEGGGLLAFDATTIYAAGSVIQKTPKAGGPTVTLAAGTSASAIAVDDTHVYWVTPGTDTGAKWNADATLIRVPK